MPPTWRPVDVYERSLMWLPVSFTVSTVVGIAVGLIPNVPQAWGNVVLGTLLMGFVAVGAVKLKRRTVERNDGDRSGLPDA